MELLQRNALLSTLHDTVAHGYEWTRSAHHGIVKMLFAKQSLEFAEAPSFAASVSNSTRDVNPMDFDRPLVGECINTPQSWVHN